MTRFYVMSIYEITNWLRQLEHKNDCFTRSKSESSQYAISSGIIISDIKDVGYK